MEGFNQMTTDSYVRLVYIKLGNFKNVVSGEIRLEDNLDCNASVLGLYGQNGSGKTALIDAIDLLSWLLKGQRVPSRFTDFINVQSEAATVEYHFEVKLGTVLYNAQYHVRFRADHLDAASNINGTHENNGRSRILVVEDERL